MIPFTCNFCTIICTHSLLLSLLSLLTFPYPYQPFSGSRIPFAFSPPLHYRDFFPWSSITWTYRTLSYTHLSSHWCFSSSFAWWSHFSVVNTWASCVRQCFAMVPHHHEQWQNFSYIAYHSHCLSLSLLGMIVFFPVFIHGWVANQVSSQNLCFIISPAMYLTFPIVLASCFFLLFVSKSMWIECNDVFIILSLSFSYRFHPLCLSWPHFCWHVVLLFSQSLVLWISSLVFFSLPSCAHILQLYICTATMARN